MCLPIAEKYFAGQYWEHISTFNIFNGMIFLCRNKLTFIRTQADLAGQGQGGRRMCPGMCLGKCVEHVLGWGGLVWSGLVYD